MVAPLESVVEEAQRLHQRTSMRMPEVGDYAFCSGCGEQWPCVADRLADRVEADRRWMAEAALALEAASVIGEREGCHLNYGNHDRLLAEYRQALSTQPHQDKT